MFSETFFQSFHAQAAKAKLDLTKDVVVELDGQDVPADAMVKVSIALNQIGVKSFYDVAYIRYAPTLTIPAAAFRNINIKPAGSALFSYSDSFLSVSLEGQVDATDVTGVIATIPYTRAYSDGEFVSVTGEPKLNPGLSTKGTLHDMTYDAFKAGAFLSRPLSQIKKVGVVSLAIRGTTFHEWSESTTSSNTLVMGGLANTTTTTTTKTTTLAFPQQSDATWDALLAKLYPAFMGVLKETLGADEVPVDSITGTRAYSEAVSLAKDDSNTKVFFARSYRDTKVMSAFMPVSEGYGSSSVNDRIMKESGADALATFTLDLAIGYDKDDKVLMLPSLAFELTGRSNGPNASTNTSPAASPAPRVWRSRTT